MISIGRFLSEFFIWCIAPLAPNLPRPASGISLDWDNRGNTLQGIVEISKLHALVVLLILLSFMFSYNYLSVVLLIFHFVCLL